MARARRSEGLQSLYDQFIGDDPAKVDAFEVAKSNAEVALSIYQLRTNAGMTPAALARIVGTTPSVISRLEDADYDGHSLSMLKRIAEALGRRVVIRFALLESAAKTTKAAVGHPPSRFPGRAIKSGKIAASPKATTAAVSEAPKTAAAPEVEAAQMAHSKGAKKRRIKA